MIKLIFSRSIFQVESCAYVNPVNCKGVMSAGLAYQFKKMYPSMFREYREVCRQRGGLTPGKLHIYKTDNVDIINLPTKDDWRKPSKYGYIEEGIIALRKTLQEKDYKKVSIPALGCGRGGLRWNAVREIIHHYLIDYPGVIYLFPPKEKE